MPSAEEFGRRHPGLVFSLGCVVLACLVPVCAYQIWHGAYLGRGWLAAAVAGMAAAAILNPPVMVSLLRHGRGRFEVTWLLLGLLSVGSIELPFPGGRGPYGSAWGLFNVVHAALLGYYAVFCLALIALVAYMLAHPHLLRQPSVRGLPDETGQPARRRILTARAWPAWVLSGAAAGVVAGFILAAVGGAHGAATTAAGWVILLALAAACVAVPAALYRRYRSRRVVAVSPSLLGASTAADPTAQD